MTIFKRVFILLVISGLFLAGQVNVSRAAVYSDEIPLRLKTGKVTEAEFPEKIVDVIKSISSEALQVETMGNRMFLLPLKEFDSYLHVITQDNISYCLHLIMDEAEAPNLIKIKRPAEKPLDPQNMQVANTVDLMKALLTGRQPPGAVSSKLHSQEIFNNAKLRISIDEVYEFPNNVKALVLTFENLTRKPVVIPIEHIELPGLLAISVDSQILEARPQDTKKTNSAYTAKAYMVVEGLAQ